MYRRAGDARIFCRIKCRKAANRCMPENRCRRIDHTVPSIYVPGLPSDKNRTILSARPTFFSSTTAPFLSLPLAPSAPPREPKNLRAFASSREYKKLRAPRLRANLFPHSHEAHRATAAPPFTLPTSSTSAPHPAFKLSRFTLYPSKPYRLHQSH